MGFCTLENPEPIGLAQQKRKFRHTSPHTMVQIPYARTGISTAGQTSPRFRWVTLLFRSVLLSQKGQRSVRGRRLLQLTFDQAASLPTPRIQQLSPCPLLKNTPYSSHAATLQQIRRTRTLLRILQSSLNEQDLGFSAACSFCFFTACLTLFSCATRAEAATRSVVAFTDAIQAWTSRWGEEQLQPLRPFGRCSRKRLSSINTKMGTHGNLSCTEDYDYVVAASYLHARDFEQAVHVLMSGDAQGAAASLRSAAANCTSGFAGCSRIMQRSTCCSPQSQSSCMQSAP